MSIAISAGLETPDASYPDMAAGPELEPVEASPAACGGGSGHLHCYMGLPYADHNYGARPPPTPPASPQPAGPIRSEELPLVPTAQDEVSRGTTFSTSEDGSYGADVTRCICGFTHDDGYMICCDRCSVWQHIDCMGIDRQHIPETYLCEHCQPRNLDLNRAILLQTRKRENLSDRDTSATESGDEVPMELYTTFRHATASLVLTAARPHCKSSDKRRKRSRDKEPPAVTTRAKKAFREGSRRSSRGKASAPETDLADTPLLWESKMKTWMEQYEEASSNQYSEEMQILLRLEEAQRTATPAYSSRGATFKPPVESYPQKNRKILKAVRDLAPNTLIIEYRGKFMLRHQFEANGYFCKRPYPFVLFYSKFHGLDVCVDARSFGNEARFVRRSCSPNAEVRHIIDGGTLRLYLYSVRHITRGGEITIGFDYDYGSCKFKVDCACFRGTLECPVQRRHAEPTENLGSAGESRRRRGRRDREAPREKNAEGAQNQNIAVDGDYAKGKAVGENRQWKMSPLRLSIANNQTREERKMEAILQAFAQMEKRAKRREQALERIGTKVEVGGRGDVKDEPPSVPEAEAPAPAQPEVDAVKEESAGDPGAMQITSAGKVSRSKQRKSLSRSRAHVGQQRRRSRTISACSELPPVSPAECLEAPPPEAPESQPPAAPESETPLAPSVDASPSHSSSPALSCQAVLKYPKTKKHLVSEWMVEKQERTVQTPEPPPDRPLRISNDPEVLATQLNSLPGMTCSPQVYSTPKHYVRFSSPFLSSRSTGVPSARRRSHELLETPPTSGFCKKRWLRQALEEEGSPGSTGGSVLVIPSEMPLSPLTEVLDATIPFNGSCLLPEVPTPLKKRRLCPLDSSMSEGSTPYGSPCATPTRPEPLEMHPIPFTLGTPPHTQPEEQAADLPPALPLIMPQEVKAEHPPSLLSSPCVRAPAVDVPSLEVKPLGAWSPQHPQVQDSNREEVRADRAADAPLADPPLPSHPPWTRSPEKAPFSLVNSNLRDLTPSHTLEPGVFSEGAGDYPYPEDTVAFVCSAGGDYTGEGGGGTLQNPPQKKKVSLLEYRKRQKEAGRSSSKGECESPIPGALALGGLCNGSTVEPYPSDTETLDRMTPHLDGPEGEEGGEGPWTVSQARERDDVHGLGLPSTCRRDRDADDEETERDDHASGKEDFESPGSHRPDSPGAGLCHSFTKRAAGDEEVETPAGSPCLSPSSQKPCKPPGKLAPLTPSKLPPQTALQAQASPYRSQWMFHSGQPQPQASLASASYVQFSTQSVPPPPPPPAPPSSGAYCPGGTPVSAGSFPGYQSAVASPFSPGSRAVLQAHHSLNYQSSVAPPPPPHPHQTPPLLHISLASPVQQQHQILLTAVPPSSILSSASPPPPPPPQSQTVSQQHPPSGGTLFSLQQAPPPPPPPPPVSSSNPSLHFQGTGGFQASHLYPGTSGTSVVTLTSYSPHQQGVIPAPSQQLGPVQALAVPSRGALSTSAPFHGSGYLGSGWH